MSGPYCETCKYFIRYPIVKDGSGECLDPAKIIYSSGNDAVNLTPIVGQKYECINHKISASLNSNT